MKRVVVCIVFWAALLAMRASAENADLFPGVIDITEPCPVTGDVAAVKAPTTDERVYGGISVTPEEKDVLAAILWAEANNQCVDGQKGCIEVVFNRINSSDWPDTLIGVLSQKGQFATWKYRNRVKPTQEQYDVIDAVLAETERVLPSGEYVYFDTKGRNGKGHVKIQDHYFGR